MAKRTRDPEGRRNSILSAAAELIREIGVSAVTHRKVAERAKVPLGSTTQYFASLADLVAEALTGMLTEQEKNLHDLVSDLQQAEDPASFLAELVERCYSDPKLLRNELSFWLLSTTHPKLKRLMHWNDNTLVEALTQISTRQRAQAVMIHLHGLMLHCILHERGIPRAEMEESFRQLLSAPVTEPPPGDP